MKLSHFFNSQVSPSRINALLSKYTSTHLGTRGTLDFCSSLDLQAVYIWPQVDKMSLEYDNHKKMYWADAIKGKEYEYGIEDVSPGIALAAACCRALVGRFA